MKVYFIQSDNYVVLYTKAMTGVYCIKSIAMQITDCIVCLSKKQSS